MSLSDALVAPAPLAPFHNDSPDIDMLPISETDQSAVTASLPEDEEMEDLFGEDIEVHVQKPERAVSSESDPGQPDAISDAEQRHREAMEYAEHDEPDQDPNSLLEQHTEANAAIPNIPIPKSSDGQNWVIRMPNFVKVDSKPFHPDTYIGPEQEEEDIAGSENIRERSMSIKLKVENTLRWRWIKDSQGTDQRQSNSRIIRWSDGTLSLLLGKELFDISQQVDTSLANSRTVINGSSQQSNPSQNVEPSLTPLTIPNGAKNQGLTYLVAQHKRAEILQSEALVTGYMTLRPTGMQSETHRMLVRAVGQKHNKVARLRMAPDPTTDPEREKMELLKSSAKSKTKRPKYEDDGFGGSSGGASGGRRRRAYARKRGGDGVWSDDEDGEDDAERDVFGAGSDEDEDMTTGRASSSRKPRRNKASTGDTRTGGGDYQTDDFVVSDSPSEEGDADLNSARTSRKKRKRNASEEVEDDLDKLDAKIEEAERMKEKSGSDGNVSDEQLHDQPERGDMDVESEEADEEDEHQVRRAGGASSGRTRRFAADLEEEE